MTKRLGVLIVSGVLACLCAAHADASAKPSCRAGKVIPGTGGVRTRAVAHTKKILVWGDDVPNYYTCAKPNGKSYFLGQSTGIPDDNVAVAQGPYIVGRYVSGVFGRGIASQSGCGKLFSYYGLPPDGTVVHCDATTPRYTIQAVDPFTGQSAHLQVQNCTRVLQPLNNDPNPPLLATYACTITPFVMSSAGALAWIDNRGLVAGKFNPKGKKLNAGPTVIDPNAKLTAVVYGTNGQPLPSPSAITSVNGLTVNWYDTDANGTRVSHSATYAPKDPKSLNCWVAH